MFEIHDSLQDVLGATATRELLVKRASESLDSLLQDSDKDSGLLKDVSISYRKIGDIFGGTTNQGSSNLSNGTDAVVYYRKAFEIQKTLFEADFQNLEFLQEYAITITALADLSFIKGEIDEALKYCRLAQEKFVDIHRNSLSLMVKCK